MRYPRLVPVLALAVTLTGCDNFLVGDRGMIHDRGQDYEKAQVIEPIKVPEPLDNSSIRELLPVPDIGTAATVSEKAFEVPRPDFFYAEAGNASVNLAREGRDKLILVDEPQQDVWVKVENFWEYNGVKVALSDPANGVMETAWIDNKDEEPGFFSKLLERITFQEVSGPAKDKLRVSVSRGKNPDQTAIRLQHTRRASKQPDAPVDWSSSEAQDLSYQSELMYELLHYLSRASDQNTATALAHRQQDGNRALLGRDSQGNPVLKVSGEIDGVWDQVRRSMADAAFDVGSADRRLGKYYITYTTTTAFEESKETGFWAFLRWLHGDREDIKISSEALGEALGFDQPKPEEKIRYSQTDQPEVDPNDLSQKEGYKIWLGDRVIYVFESDKSGFTRNADTGKLEHTGHYQVTLNRRRSGVFVSVLTDEGQDAPPVVAEEILWAIKDHLPAG